MQTTLFPHKTCLAGIAVAAALVLAGCGGGNDPQAIPAGAATGGAGGGGAGGGTGGGTSTAGPTVDLSLLAKLCPVYDATSKIYSHCKASADPAVNAVLIDINTWLAANSPMKKVAAGPDASYAVAAGDSCDFGFEPGLGIWMMTLKNASGPNIAWSGTAVDAVQVDANGVIVYMSASTDGTGAGFSNGAGQMEINFPGVTNGTIMEAVYGHDAKIVDCLLAG